MAARDQEEIAKVNEEEVVADNTWSTSTTRLLIDFYRQNRLLWDKSHKDFGNHSKTSKALLPLVSKLEKASPPRSQSDIKKRWRGLRTCLLRYTKKSADQDVRWTYWSDLLFLRESQPSDEAGSGMIWRNQDIEILIDFFQANECLWNHNSTEYHQNSNKDLLYDMLGKELEDKYDADDIKKKWKELLKRFKQEHAKASVKPSGAGTADIYKPSWEFYEQLKYVIVICGDTDDTVNSIGEPSKPKVKKVSKQRERDNREDRKLELFSEAVMAMREPEVHREPTTSTENSEAAAFANYVRLTMSKLNPRNFRKAKKCIGDILYQIEESEDMESTSGIYPRFNTQTSYGSRETNYNYQGMPIPESIQMQSYNPGDY